MTVVTHQPTTSTPTIAQAMSAVMGDVRAVGKDSVNQQQRFNFRGIDAVVNAVGPVLRRYRVIVTPNVTMYEHGTIEVGNNRTPMGHARVIVQYTFTGPAGDTIVCSAPGEAMDSGDKATAKAMSVAFRTALLQALALPTDEIDPDAQTYERSASTNQSRGQQQKQPLQGGQRRDQGSPRGQHSTQTPQQAAVVTPTDVRTQISRWANSVGYPLDAIQPAFAELYPQAGHITNQTNIGLLQAFFARLRKEVEAEVRRATSRPGGNPPDVQSMQRMAQDIKDGVA